MAVIDPGVTVAEVVTERPERARVFETFRIDYSCNGRLSLARACREQGLDVEAVLASLAACDSQMPSQPPEDWATTRLSVLCHHIVSVHHRYLQAELPRATRLANLVAQAHGTDDARLAALRFVLRPLRSALEVHMVREERIVFPAIVRLDDGACPDESIGALLRGLEGDHRNTEAVLHQIRVMTGDLDRRAARSSVHESLLESLAQLEFDTHQHVHKENNILFERARRAVESGARVG
jgi:regulator of cell morphogenesis and NO signaling